MQGLKSEGPLLIVNINSLFTLKNSQPSWIQPEPYALWENYLRITYCLLMIYVFGPCINVLQLLNICCDYMLLKTKLFLIVTGQSLCFFMVKTMNNL